MRCRDPELGASGPYAYLQRLARLRRIDRVVEHAIEEIRAIDRNGSPVDGLPRSSWANVVGSVVGGIGEPRSPTAAEPCVVRRVLTNRIGAVDPAEGVCFV